MEYLLFFICVALCSFKTKAEVDETKLPNIRTKLFEPEANKTAFEFTWDPVKNWDEENPVIGYKLAVWKMKKKINKVLKLVNGEFKVVEEEDESFPSPIPFHGPEIFTVTQDERKVVYNDVQKEVWYEIAALAFTKKGQGPLSSPVGLKVNKKKEAKKRDEINNE